MTTLAAAFLCLAVLLPSPAPGQAIERARTCCLTTTNTKIRVGLVDHYRIQKKGPCPVDAVVFFTIRGLSICSKPSDPWTQRAMATVDSRKRTTPTTSTTSPNASSESTASLLSTTDKTTR
ncbi:monocyte chemotactic protein 1B-like [Anguilla anguilla]|uniref:monocyte chemotactic protein 1B-like n=1 Tax=Anguilla anguilla TaxID=7936 RepID=UPI0015AC1464|nr:monocyte chemotactic protein 1B-like [Anguilla anguilla]